MPWPLPLPVLTNQPKPLGCPILRAPDRPMVGERTPLPRRSYRCLFSSHPPQKHVISTGAKRSGETPVFRFCFCRCLFTSNQPKPLGCPIHRALAMGGMYKFNSPNLCSCPEPPSRSYPALIPVPVLPDPQIPNIHAPIPPPQTIFHAFTQQNRMSSPQTHQKSSNTL